jgi:hypothetical protein
MTAIKSFTVQAPGKDIINTFTSVTYDRSQVIGNVLGAYLTVVAR